MANINPSLTKDSRKQRTLKNEASFSGIGIHTGQEVFMRFCPAKEGTGIVFRRIDLPGKPLIPATLEYVCDTLRSTTIGIGNIRIHTVEHVLAAIRGYEIDNLYIDISNVEPPVGNGSSDVFVEMIESVGIEEQSQTVPIIKVLNPIYFSDGDIHLVVLPYDGYRISYTLNYTDAAALRSQFHTLVVTPESFKNEISQCRTFSRYDEVKYLMDRGLIKGGGLSNAVIIMDDVVFSKDGLFFPNEMGRHKILDMIGDLSLIGFYFHGHVIAIKAGHASNFAFAQKLYKYITMENK